MSMTIALAGNPNSGKTTLFNALTGSNQHVGNWPGVTVERKEGQTRYGNQVYRVVDLPGTYSLGAFSEDEVVAREFIVSGNPDVVINVVDATNIERNLYLTTQLLEMGTKVVVALNMVDEAESREIHVDEKALAQRLGVPVIRTVASRRKGIDELMEAAIAVARVPLNGHVQLSYGESIDKRIEVLKGFLQGGDFRYPSSWLALKLLEGDSYAKKFVFENSNLRDLEEFSRFWDEVAVHEEEFQLEIVDSRYKFVGDITKDVVRRPGVAVETTTDKVDRVLTHKYWGMPIFAAIMFAIFQLTFAVGQDLLGEWMAVAIDYVGGALEGFLVGVNAPAWLIDFIGNGMVAGVGAVVEFVPLIVILYLLMGLLEDSGYMARAAYVMDNTMRAVGLQGKTFISMIVGFGCNVPGVMATRTLENKKDRMIAILINPFMSCGAKIPIYLVFIAAFFPSYGGLVLFSVYALGVAVAFLMGKIFSKTLFKGETSHFIMELPPYRKPTLSNVVRNMWDNVSGFLARAGTIILAVVSLLWVLAVLPLGVEPYGSASILGRIGQFIAPIFEPAGFGTWQAAVGLFSGIAAKEAVVATLGMVYAGVEAGTELVAAIREVFTPLTAVSFMVMTLLYTPCAATLGTIKKETGSAKWTLFSAFYSFGIAWVLSVLVFQVGRVLGFS
ncbi:MAG TPA: ferrous iron transport protein B [Firmicutes bacterium]|nr:ferrous iron transport protein B [Bacillota bacterium]